MSALDLRFRLREGLDRIPTPIFSMCDNIDGMTGRAWKAARLLIGGGSLFDDLVALVLNDTD